MTYHNTLDALVFDQTAAEDYALYVQSFALARLRLQEAIAARLAAGADPASFYITTDCDETILDNSAYNAWLVRTGRDFNAETWRLWCRDQQALATPGAQDFLRHVAGLGVKVCYVTSRFEDTRVETAANLSALGFPLPDASADPATTFLFLEDMIINGVATRKQAQYDHLALRHGAPPLLQLGDNLSDHSPARYSSRVRHTDRATNAEGDHARWGADWIVFPNPVYGGWRASLKLRVGDVDVPATDELAPVLPAPPTPVRPPVTPEEALKVGLLRIWSPSTPQD